jgi:hypothetical protein
MSTNYYLVLPSAFSAPGTAPAKSSSYSNDITNYRVTIQSETNNSVENIDTSIAAINSPYAMSWAANSEYTYSYTQALAIWDTISFGNSANMATKSTWSCPAAGLWLITGTFGFSLNTADSPCSFRLAHNGVIVGYFTAWYNPGAGGNGMTTESDCVFLNLATGDTIEWYVGLNGGCTMTIGGGNNYSGSTTFSAVRIAPGYTAA